jgi:Conserved TM helix
MLAEIAWSQGIQDSWTKIATFAPKLIAALVVLIIGIIIAKIIRKALARGLKAAKVDQHLGKTGLGRSLAGAGGPSNLIVRIAYAGLLLLVAQLAIGFFGKSPIADAFNSMLAFVPKLIVAMIILFVTNFVVDKVVPILRDVMGNKPYGQFVVKAATAAIWMIGVFAALDQVQVAKDVVDTLFRTFMTSLGAIMVIKFGVGGIWAARDRFWPGIYDAVGARKPETHA